MLQSRINRIVNGDGGILTLKDYTTQLVGVKLRFRKFELACPCDTCLLVNLFTVLFLRICKRRLHDCIIAVTGSESKPFPPTTSKALAQSTPSNMPFLEIFVPVVL